KDGWIGRKKEVDLMVCMNSQTAREDVDGLQPGSLCIYDAPLNCKSMRGDVTFYEVPFAKLAGELTQDSRLRKLLTNMIYVGVVVPGRVAHRLHEAVPHQRGEEGHVRDRAGRGRDRRGGHGPRRGLGGGALDDVDLRPRHLADGGVLRPRLLRRDPRRDLGRP